MRLTDNKIECDGCVLYQVARYNTIKHAEELGGYIERNLFNKIDKSGWIGSGSKIYNCPNLQGKFIIHENVLVHNSILKGHIIIKNDVHILNSSITCTMNRMIIENKAFIQDRHFAGNGLYTQELFNDGDFIYLHQEGVHVIRTDHYARVNCTCLTYEKAWKVLNSDALWQTMMTKYFKYTPEVFKNSTREWLKKQCWEGLQKLRQG